MAELDLETRLRLGLQGVNPDGIQQRKEANMPSNTAGIPGLMMYDVPALQRSNTAGFVMPKESPGEQDRMYLRPDAGPSTVAHEAEHLLAERGLGHAAVLNSQFDKLIKKPEARMAFVNAAIEAAPYLQEKYGNLNAYFQPEMKKLQGSKASNLLYEQLATLAGIEATQGVDLTKDPVLRKTLFKDRDVRETYNALTGLRQTRMDAKDLPPHTRLPEKDSAGTVQKLKSMLGFADGGDVPDAGRNRLI